MKKVKALVTLVVGKGEEVPPEIVCEVSDDEAKRLIALGFAKATNEKTQGKDKETDNDESNQKSGGQPVLQAGTDGDLQK